MVHSGALLSHHGRSTLVGVAEGYGEAAEPCRSRGIEHSVYGKAWSALRRPLDPLTQDSCAFYGDHVVFDDYTGVVLDLEEGKRIAHALGDNKAVILSNHGLLTVGHSVDEAAWWFITMERTCQAQLLAQSAGTPVSIDADQAEKTAMQVGQPLAGWISFQPLYDWITAQQPELLDD